MEDDCGVDNVQDCHKSGKANLITPSRSKQKKDSKKKKKKKSTRNKKQEQESPSSIAGSEKKPSIESNHGRKAHHVDEGEGTDKPDKKPSKLSIHKNEQNPISDIEKNKKTSKPGKSKTVKGKALPVVPPKELTVEDRRVSGFSMVSALTVPKAIRTDEDRKSKKKNIPLVLPRDLTVEDRRISSAVSVVSNITMPKAIQTEEDKKDKKRRKLKDQPLSFPNGRSFEESPESYIPVKSFEKPQDQDDDKDDKTTISGEAHWSETFELESQYVTTTPRDDGSGITFPNTVANESEWAFGEETSLATDTPEDFCVSIPPQPQFGTEAEIVSELFNCDSDFTKRNSEIGRDDISLGPHVELVPASNEDFLAPEAFPLQEEEHAQGRLDMSPHFPHEEEARQPEPKQTRSILHLLFCCRPRQRPQG